MTKLFFRPTVAMALAVLLAAPAVANQLLKERWLMTASASDIRHAIAAGADINATHPKQSFTPLMATARHNNLVAMEALLEAGADPNRQVEKTGLAPMHFAETGKAVALLFDYGASVKITSKVGNTPLHLAGRDTRIVAAHQLIRRGADINPPNEANVIPLHMAAKHSTPDMVEFLLDAGANPTIQTRNGWFPAEVGFNNTKLRDTKAFRRLLDPLLDIPALPGEVSVADCNGWRVRQGDTPRTILAEGVGDQSTWLELARLNELSGRNMHRVGMCLKLPARKAEASPPARRPACDGYVVQASDRKLGDIAEKTLGDRNRWPEIARLNGLSLEKPHRIGQCLELPG